MVKMLLTRIGNGDAKTSADKKKKRRRHWKDSGVLVYPCDSVSAPLAYPYSARTLTKLDLRVSFP